MGFNEVKARVIADLLSQNFVHQGRNDIDEKNLLQLLVVSAEDVAGFLKKSRGQEYAVSPHHQDASIDVHVIKCRNWYVKFYFDPETTFISVHR